MDKESSYYSALRAEDRFTEAQPARAENANSYYPELHLEHRRDDMLFWVILAIALILAGYVAGVVLWFFYFFR